jgi:hypothetical protein
MSEDRWNIVNLRPFDAVLEELLSTVDPLVLESHT